MERLTLGEEFILKWQYRKLGRFYSAIALACSKAEISDLRKLGKGFPEEVKAYRNYTEKRGWWDSLKDKAKKLGWNI